MRNIMNSIQNFDEEDALKSISSVSAPGPSQKISWSKIMPLSIKITKTLKDSSWPRTKWKWAKSFEKDDSLERESDPGSWSLFLNHILQNRIGSDYTSPSENEQWSDWGLVHRLKIPHKTQVHLSSTHVTPKLSWSEVSAGWWKWKKISNVLLGVSLF